MTTRALRPAERPGRAAAFADHYVRARAGDDDALAAFGPRDGRPTGP
ncbi:hypothetical protein FNQ90_02800 [Streptomyces alkaliphilus]|uniref:Uncharacterized protein n=1 Tax=Streptomyces alkaliphilus TaxID=1472722 RepID=A0A7W3TAH3_9ACTN|nr:hypothetical protein [Streptomyces alkaliphilus]MBB0243065.1 hypothetical protein [Streptomyces alkaliphilus]